MTTCTSCGTGGQPEGARFCFSCGGGLGQPPCTSCGTELIAGARFCSSCGAEQGEQAPDPQHHPVSARRVATVLFGDLVGFTTLSETRDTEEVRELLSRYFEEARSLVERYGGTVEKFIGDAVMAVWGVPAGHEDDAERAVRAGLEMVTRVTALGADVGVPDLAMRVGVVTGEVAVTIGATQQGMVAGDVVNTAARVQTAAAPGQVWVDETTRLLTSGSVTYVDVGSHALKGKADPMPLWSARAVVAGVGGGQRADGLEAPIVGRDRELRLVKELFHGVEESHRPALLVVGGEAGVGKSRLGWELFKYIDGLSRPVRWHSGRCLAYGEGVAFFALADAIRARLQLSADGDEVDGEDNDGEADDAASLLEAGLDRYVPDPEERRWLEPRLGALLGVGSPGNFQREDLFGAWAMFLQRVGEDEHPVVLLIDDAHHADDGLVTFVEHLLAVAGFGCLVVLLTRPGLLDEHPGLASNRRSTVLHLEPLAEPEMGSLVDGLVAGLPDGARAALVERAEGIPLYAVETIRSLIDRDLVVPRGGQYVLADPTGLDLDAVGAPASLQTLIAARLDTLTPAQRRVIDQGSVLGISFTRDSIARLCPDVADLDQVLAALVRLQVLQQDSSRFSAERGQFQFVQTAVRQIAYNSIARRDRKAAHLAVVAELTDYDSATELAAVIAQHYLDAIDVLPGDPDVPALTRAAVDSLRRAAGRAAALGSPGEAVGHLSEALERSTDVRERAELVLGLAQELQHSGRYAEAEAQAQLAERSFDELGEELLAASATVIRADSLIGMHEGRRAAEIVRPLYDRLRGRDDAAGIFLGLGRVLVSVELGQSRAISNLLDELIPVAEQTGNKAASADFYISLAVHFQTIGANRIGLVLNRASADLARETHDPVTLSRALINLNAASNQEDAGQSMAIGREALAVATATGRAYYVSAAAVNLAIASWLSGAWDEILAMGDEVNLETRDQVIVDLFAVMIRWERGEAPDPLEVSPPDGDELALDAWRQITQAWNDQYLRFDRRASGLALEGIRGMYDSSGLYDDFTVVWGLAVDIAFTTDDESVLDELCAYVDAIPDSALVNGMRAHRAYVAARQAERSDPEQASEHYRAAVQHYSAWGAPFYAARAQAAHSRFLRGQGLSEEAEKEATAAREALAALRADRQLEQLAETAAEPA